MIRATSRRLGFLYLLFFAFLACNNNHKEYSRSPEAEQKSFQFADPDLRISLVASEPDIKSPVAMSWTPDGALLVVEIPGYPVSENTGQIKRLTDPDGDGHYHLSSIFAKDLNFPTSAMPYKDGVLVTDAPYIYFIKDLDGDGISDTREIVLSGFSTGNEQYRANSLHWGLDNWIYGAGGRSGGQINYTGDEKKVSIANRDFRFKPDDHLFEAVSGMSQFGLAKDNWGNRYVSLNHRFARQVVLEEYHLARNPSLSSKAIFDTSINEHDRRVYTLLENARRFNTDPIGYFTSLSGLTAYRGHLLGSSYEHAFFAGESAQAAVISRKMQADGPAFTAKNTIEEAEFLATKDSWFHPVNFANGPDGALYMVDFYRKYVEHPQWAYENLSEGVDWKEGENHGRIWRITHKDKVKKEENVPLDFTAMTGPELVAQLASNSGWCRDMAQQILIERQAKEAVPALKQMVLSDAVLGRIHALWTLDGLGELNDPLLLEAMNTDSEAVLVQLIKISAQRLDTSSALERKVATLAVSDKASIRYQAILALGNSVSPESKSNILDAAKTFDDNWTRTAVLSSISLWAEEFSRSYLDTYNFKSERDKSTSEFFGQLGTLTARRSTAVKVTNWISRLYSGSQIPNTSKLDFLAGYLNGRRAIGAELPKFPPSFSQALVATAMESRKEDLALIAIDLLGFSEDKNTSERLSQLVLNAKSELVSIAAVKQICALNDSEILGVLFTKIGRLSPEVRKELIANSLASENATTHLLVALEQQQITVSEIAEELRHSLLSYPVESIKQRARAILEKAVDPDRQAIVESYLKQLDHQGAQPSNGKSLFNSYCSSCHSINGEGGLLGPDLTNFGDRSDKVLLVSILDPGRMVSYELKLYIVSTKSGEVYSGMLSNETLKSITIKQPNGQEHTLFKEDIENIEETDQSIMPEGFERVLNEKDMADLLAFIRNPDF